MKRKDKVIFNMATFPPRINSMQETVSHILPQCDKLNIYLNNFDYIPTFLIDKKINVIRSQDCAEMIGNPEFNGDIGDVGKFWNWDCEEGYFFTVDDKFAYPKNYTNLLIEYIERYERKAVISFHGRLFHEDRKSTSYYWDCKQFLGCLGNVPEDVWVHEVGTGVMAFHTDTLQPDLSIFHHANMTDILFSMHCQRLGIPLMVAKHNEGFLKLIIKHDTRVGISVMNNQKDKIMTDLINNFIWKINKVG